MRISISPRVCRIEYYGSRPAFFLIPQHWPGSATLGAGNGEIGKVRIDRSAC
jgi:hypothetical protein